LHYYYAHPGFCVGNSASKLHDGLDIRGDGGYVVAPGSIHETGFEYAWDKGYSPADLPLAEAPKWLLDELRPHEHLHTQGIRREYAGTTSPYARAALEGERDRVLGAREGCRNATLNRAAFSLGGGELEASEVRDVLASAASGWDDNETWRQRTITTIERAVERGANQPRGGGGRDRVRMSIKKHRSSAKLRVVNKDDAHEESGAPEPIDPTTVWGDLAVSAALQHRSAHDKRRLCSIAPLCREFLGL
jgi:hypothetical protein